MSCITGDRKASSKFDWLEDFEEELESFAKEKSIQYNFDFITGEPGEGSKYDWKLNSVVINPRPSRIITISPQKSGFPLATSKEN